MATTDIPAGAVLTDCMNAALLTLPKERRLQWIAQTTSKTSCPCERCKNPRKADAQLVATVPGTTIKVNQEKLEADYDAILKQYSKLSLMPRTAPDEPAYSSPSLDDKYWDACYSFLSHIHTFLTCYHMLSPLHWRKQYLRNLFVTLVAKHELFDLDLMHPHPKRITSENVPLHTAYKVPNKHALEFNPMAKGYEETRTRNHWFLQMILSNVLAQLECNAQFFNSHEPLKCSAMFLLYSLIDWFQAEEHTHCRVTSKAPDCSEVVTSCFSFTFERRKKDMAGYLRERMRQIEPVAEQMLKKGFPLRA